MDSAGIDRGLDDGHTLVDADGRKVALTTAESEEMLGAVFTHMSLIEWQESDVLLWDNMLFGHCRMPGCPPRRLHALFGNQVDTREYRQRGAVRVVDEAATAPVKSGNELILAMLGRGGNVHELQRLTATPNWVFRLLGKMLWA